jgi:hypothetical protein
VLNFSWAALLRNPKLIAFALAVHAASMAGFAQFKPCELQSEVSGLHVKPKAIQTQVANGAGSFDSRSTLRLDEAGRPLTLIVEDGSGHTTESTTWKYGAYGTLGSVTNSSDPGKTSKCVVDYASGQILEVYTAAANGIVTGRVLFDLTQSSNNAITRTVSFRSQQDFEFNQKGRFDARDGNLTNIGLITNGHEVGVWTIRHKNKGVVRDEVQFADLSFSKREFHRDGTYFVHDFSSASRSHTFAWYRSDSQPARVVSRSPAAVTEISYTYGSRGRITVIRRVGRHAKQDETTFEYTDDADGDWTTRVKKINGEVVETASRTFVQ